MAQYIDNKRFTAAIREYYERKKTNPNERIPEEIGNFIILLAKRLSTRYNFVNYTYRDEFVSDGILRAVEAFKNFDPERSNPFAYFSKVLFRSFIQRIKKEKTERAMRDRLIMTDDLFFLQEGDSCNITRDQVIGDYEFNSGE
jgi:DNA-directed RNA polymerase specialized sigma24 family protein